MGISEQSLNDIWLYCPVDTYFFSNTSEDDFYNIDWDDEEDLKNAAKITEVQEKWLTSMKNVIPHTISRLSDIDVEGNQYDELKKQIKGYGIDMQIHGNSAWMAVKYTFEASAKPNIKLLKEYVTEQLIELLFYIAEWTNQPINGGMFVMDLQPADYCNGPNQYNIWENNILLCKELPI